MPNLRHRIRRQSKLDALANVFIGTVIARKGGTGFAVDRKSKGGIFGRRCGYGQRES